MRLLLILAAAAAMAQPMPKTLPSQWWRQQRMIDELKLSTEQQKRLEDAFQQNRVKLIDTTAALDREEAIMDQLMMADVPDAAKVRPQIDRVAQARAELEKTNAYMLLNMRLVLSREQWDNLRNAIREGRGPFPRKPGR
jgi:Spy/CpxP family protein refolding chaperone